jgi:hypothetical protein
LVERSPEKAGVGGSIPSLATTCITCFCAPNNNSIPPDTSYTVPDGISFGVRTRRFMWFIPHAIQRNEPAGGSVTRINTLRHVIYRGAVEMQNVQGLKRIRQVARQTRGVIHQNQIKRPWLGFRRPDQEIKGFSASVPCCTLPISYAAGCMVLGRIGNRSMEHMGATAFHKG